MKKKQTKKSAVHSLNHGIFFGTTVLLYNMTFGEIMLELNEGWRLGLEEDKDLIETGGNMLLKRVSTKQSYYYLILKEFNFTDHDMAVLAHELIHLCQFLLPEHNVELEKETECVAYFHTYMMNQVLTFLRSIK